MMRNCLSLEGSNLPGAITGNLSHFLSLSKKFRDFEVDLSGILKVSPPVLRRLGLINRSVV